MRGGMYAWMGRWGKRRVTEYKSGGGGAGGDVSIAVLIGTSCCEMLTCCLNSPGVPAHAPCSVCCFVCVWMHVRVCAWLYSGTLWQIILCIYPHMHFPHWLTHEPSYRQYICALVWQASQTLSFSNTHTRMHAHGDSIIRTQPTNNAICVGNPYVTFLTVREAWDDSTRACTRHIHQHMQNSSSSLLYNLYKKTQGHW